jgi:hypothetical protein
MKTQQQKNTYGRAKGAAAGAAVGTFAGNAGAGASSELGIPVASRGGPTGRRSKDL